MSNEDLIHAIIYTDFHDEVGPNPIYWLPSKLSENVRMLVSIKTVTLLSGSYGYVPESLIILPFPSIKLKGIIKYIEREDDKRRGKSARSAITFLFRESDDVIFYKYISYLDNLFSRTSKKIKTLEDSDATEKEINLEIDQLRYNVLDLLDELRKKELSISESKEFPEEIKEIEKEVEFKFKLVVLGDPGVGKTSTVLRFTDNAFSRVYIPTMGTNISDKSFRVGNIYIELILWDIAGQIKFQTMRKHFYQGANGIILIFDITNSKSFESITAWYKDVKTHLGEEVAMLGYIFGNKLDLDDQREVKTSTATKVARALNLKYIEISALTGQNVENAFYDIAKNLIKLRKSSSK